MKTTCRPALWPSGRFLAALLVDIGGHGGDTVHGHGHGRGSADPAGSSCGNGHVPGVKISILENQIFLSDFRLLDLEYFDGLHTSLLRFISLGSRPKAVSSFKPPSNSPLGSLYFSRSGGSFKIVKALRVGQCVSVQKGSSRDDAGHRALPFFMFMV